MGKIITNDQPIAEIPFVWALQNEDRKQLILNTLSAGIEVQIKEAIKERIRTSFEADKFRKLTSKDVFAIQMVLRVPVTLITTILKDLDDAIKANADNTREESKTDTV